MKTHNSNTRFIALASIILIAAFSRLIPHPYNFTPIAAMALFGGAYFTNKKWAFAIPLLAMFVSDVSLAFINNFMLFDVMRLVVYGCFIIITCLGLLLQNKIKPLSIIGTSLVGSILFFAVTNFAVWATGLTYPMNSTGLIACYTAALPFFQNTLLGDLIYCGVLFGSFEFAKQKFPVLAGTNKIVVV